MSSFEFQNRVIASPFAQHHPTLDFCFGNSFTDGGICFQKLNKTAEPFESSNLSLENNTVVKTNAVESTEKVTFVRKTRPLSKIQFKHVKDTQSLVFELKSLILDKENVTAFLLTKQLLPCNVEVYDILRMFLKDNNTARLAFNRNLYFVYEYNFCSAEEIANVLQYQKLANELIHAAAVNKEFVAVGREPKFVGAVALINPYLIERFYCLTPHAHCAG